VRIISGSRLLGILPNLYPSKHPSKEPEALRNVKPTHFENVWPYYIEMANFVGRNAGFESQYRPDFDFDDTQTRMNWLAKGTIRGFSSTELGSTKPPPALAAVEGFTATWTNRGKCALRTQQAQ
jgi:hypothetical protein